MPLPNFLVIGAAKSGTTSLHRYLREHPQVFVPARGEPSFFAHEGQQPRYNGPGDEDWRFVTDLPRYEKLFEGAEGKIAVGEVSPRYLYFEQACERIKRYVPDVRLVVVLRHPVDRAYSHFLMNRDRRCEPEADFRHAIEKEDERAALNWGWDWRYVAAGRYYEQLSRYYSLFDRDRIGVFLYDDLKDDPSGFFRALFAFLGVDSGFKPDTSVRSREASLPRVPALRTLFDRPSAARTALVRLAPGGLRKRVKARVNAWNKIRPEQLSEEDRREVFDRHFRRDIERLEPLVGKDFFHWSA